jgi:hypothetical protein
MNAWDAAALGVMSSESMRADNGLRQEAHDIRHNHGN